MTLNPLALPSPSLGPPAVLAPLSCASFQPLPWKISPVMGKGTLY